MAVTTGVNSGFVTIAPTDDPAGTNATIDSVAAVTRDTSPIGYTKIIEVGFWCDNASEAGPFHIGLYAADGTYTPGEAGTKLYGVDDNAKGTDAGWKRVTVDWDISENTTYWIAVCVENTATITYINTNSAGSPGRDSRSSYNRLPDPFGGGLIANVNGAYSLYALLGGAGTNCQINISDSWKEISAMKINIGDTWKDVSSAKINIGDAWKTIY